MRASQWEDLHKMLRKLRTNGMTPEVRRDLEALVRGMNPRDRHDFYATLQEVHQANEAKKEQGK